MREKKLNSLLEFVRDTLTRLNSTVQYLQFLGLSEQRSTYFQGPMVGTGTGTCLKEYVKRETNFYVIFFTIQVLFLIFYVLLYNGKNDNVSLFCIRYPFNFQLCQHDTLDHQKLIANLNRFRLVKSLIASSTVISSRQHAALPTVSMRPCTIQLFSS